MLPAYRRAFLIQKSAGGGLSYKAKKPCVVPAQVLGMYADGDGVQVWCTDLGDGCDWFFTVDAKTDLRIYDRVQLVVEDNDTPDDFTDDRVVDALFCHDCDGVDD